MKKVKITAPNKEFTGKRGGVGFVDGVGETDDPSMVAYFSRHGYGVAGEEPAVREPVADEPAPGLKDEDEAEKAAPAPAPKLAKKAPTKKSAPKPAKK